MDKDRPSLDVLDAGRPGHVVQRHPHAPYLRAADLPVGEVLVPRDRLVRPAPLQDEVGVEEGGALRTHQLRHGCCGGRVLCIGFFVPRLQG